MVSEKEISVSVIIPARNSESTIEETLKSIIGQKTKLNIEIIVVDNNSRDRTVEICQKFNARVIVEQKIGRSYARNCGVNSSQGEWICFIDSDVVLSEGWFKAFENLLQEEFFDVFQGSTFPFSVTQELSLLEEYRKELFKLQYGGSYCSLDRVKFTAPLCNTSSCIIKRDVFMAAGKFDVEFNTYEDVDLTWSMWRNGAKFCVVPKAVSFVQYTYSHLAVLEYMKRSYNMGAGFFKIMSKWSYTETNFMNIKKRKFSKIHLALFDLLLQFFFSFGYMMGTKYKGKKCPNFHSGNYRALTVLGSGKNTLVLNPYIRLIRNSNSLLLRDIRTYKNTFVELSENTYTELEILTAIKNLKTV